MSACRSRPRDSRGRRIIIDDLRMRKLPHTAAEDLLEFIMRRYERVATLLTSNRPDDDWASSSSASFTDQAASEGLYQSKYRDQVCTQLAGRPSW